MGYCQPGTRSQSLPEALPDIRSQHGSRRGRQTASPASVRMMMGVEEPLGGEGSADTVAWGT